MPDNPRWNTALAHLQRWRQSPFTLEHLPCLGPTDSRFDHHTPPKRIQERAIIYVAENGPTCFAERFQAIRRINRTLDHPWLVAFRTVTDLTLLDLCGNWPTRAGGSQEINTGRHTTSRGWSRAIYTAYAHV